MSCAACKECLDKGQAASLPKGALRVALAGNPNCGKTTVFNAITGARQHVGNYPGVTVDRKEGSAKTSRGTDILLVDLPGAYSLTAYTQEEIVVRDVLAPSDKSQRPCAVIDVAEAGALERHLYLTVQMLELGLPVVLLCNMADEARKAGMRIDYRLLSERLGLPVVEAVARTGEGLSTALDKAEELAKRYGLDGIKPLNISYGQDLEPILKEMTDFISSRRLLSRYPARWVALKLLERDERIVEDLKGASPAALSTLLAMQSKAAEHLKSIHKAEPEAVIADSRYGYIHSVMQDVVVRDLNKDRLALTDRIDKVLVNTILGPLIMFAVMYAMFYVTFEVGAYPQGWIEDAFSWLGEAVTNIVPEGQLQSLLVSGLIDGVGGVVSFVPLIAIMFLFIAFLDDSGYMARIAYMLDRIFRIFGLHGASVMPYIVSGGIAGGCAIPGAMATRTLRSPKEKLATLLTLPFMTCGAKLPVFLLLAGVFFPDNAAGVMFGLMLTGWVFALIVARLLRSTIIKGQATPFIMELPPYRMPTLRSVLMHCWERTWMYLKKAGTILVAVSILIWASMNYPQLDDKQAAMYEEAVTAAEAKLESVDEKAPEYEALKSAVEDAKNEQSSAELKNSFAGRLGRAIEPVTLPAGFDWRTDIALLGGIAAKEAILSTLGTAYSLGEVDPEDAPSLSERLSKDPGWSKSVALSLMLFVLLYSPCFVALVVIKEEAGSWKWLAFSLVFNTLLAYGVAVAAMRFGKVLFG